MQQDGRDYIQFDRVGEPILRVFRPDDWIPEHEPRPLSDVAKARIAYEADREYRRALGEPVTVPWLSLGDEARVDFMHNGPVGEARRGLYRAVMGFLSAA